MNAKAKGGDFGRVALLMGGTSAEREVSLRSGAACLAALRRRQVEVEPIDAGPDLLAHLSRETFDRVFIALHGRGGEDGVLQGSLEMLGLPYTGSGPLGSALGMDKLRSKWLWLGAGLPTPDFRVVRSAAELAQAGADLGLPLFVKPACEGSSVGVGKLLERGQVAEIWGLAAGHDSLVLAERGVEGAEYTCAVLQGRALPLIRLETPHVFYDYDAKYQAADTRYHCPCGLPADQEQTLQELCLRSFQVLGGEGWGRVDFMLDDQARPWLLEINTVPGMTDHSLVPMAARAAGMDFDELVWRILETSL
jgi:D-alanine-D-alanine ligase